MGDIWDALDTGGEAGYLRLAHLGRAGSGKTFSAIHVALAVRERFGLDGPIVFADTEGGAKYLRKIVDERTGQPMRVLASRNLDKWCETIDAAVEHKAAVFVGDSVTHVWDALCKAFLAQLQEKARAKRWRVPEDLQFQDWNHIKGKWAALTERFLNAPMHMIMCGRQGWVWDMVQNERGKTELVKTDVKMKAEGEFEHESSLSLLFEQVRATAEAPLQLKVTCRKDRFDRLMGQEFLIVPGKTKPEALCEWLAPHIDGLRPGGHLATDTDSVNFGLDEYGNGDRDRYKLDREILVEKIKAALTDRHPSQSADDKKGRSALMASAFNTKSWTEIEQRLSMDDLRTGLASLRGVVAEQVTE